MSAWLDIADWYENLPRRSLVPDRVTDSAYAANPLRAEERPSGKGRCIIVVASSGEAHLVLRAAVPLGRRAAKQILVSAPESACQIRPSARGIARCDDAQRGSFIAIYNRLAVLRQPCPSFVYLNHAAPSVVRKERPS
jgi:hypothetical protein